MKPQEERLLSLAILGFFSSSLVHNLANSVCQLQLLLEEVQDRLPKRKQTQLKLTTEYLSAVVQDSQAFLQYPENRTDCELWFSLPEAVQEVTRLVEYDLKKYRIKINKRLSPTHIMGNRIVFLQVLLNLLRNSIEAMQAQPRNLRRIHINTLTLNGNLVLSVRDAGTGWQNTPQFLQTTKSSGHGLGLQYVQHHMQRSFGGECVFVPQGKKGLTVRLVFPFFRLGFLTRRKIRIHSQEPVE